MLYLDMGSDTTISTISRIATNCLNCGGVTCSSMENKKLEFDDECWLVV
jgi:hypothetical protein